MMTLVGLGMLFGFGFFAFRHFRNGRAIWGVIASFGSLLGAASLWVDYQRAMMPDGPDREAGRDAVAGAPADGTPDSEGDIFGAYEPEG